ncbi:sugar 3,4-ketoisomerase [Candidatus Pelagibacter sp.]|uniref:sugar 3,4-ketoisomerase n=1 Tax=Candidatus Pelagibacter sp. TaxID=2024849 RepID=UPI003F85A51D
MKIKKIKNQNCDLNVIENLITKNFKSQRVFFLKTNKKCLRGDHAHKLCTQVFLSIKGNIQMTVQNRNEYKILELKEFDRPVKIPPLNWVKISMKKNQILMVICDKKYSESDYIRDYKVFLNKIKKK